MLGSILCLTFITAASAAPVSPFFNYLPHYGGNRPAGPSAQVANDIFAHLPTSLQPINGAVSMEIIFPQRFPGSPAVGAGTGAALIKYTLPKAPGHKSIEIYYPYDFSPHQVMPSVPLLPQVPSIFPFDYPPQTVPQQQQTPRTAPPLHQANKRQPQIHQDQQVQAGRP